MCTSGDVKAALAVQAVGDDLVDSIVGDNIPILTEAEKFNETVISSVKRVSARLLGARCAAACVLCMAPAIRICLPVRGVSGCPMLTLYGLPLYGLLAMAQWLALALTSWFHEVVPSWACGRRLVMNGWPACRSTGSSMPHLHLQWRPPQPCWGHLCARAGQADPGPPERADTSRKRTY